MDICNSDTPYLSAMWDLAKERASRRIELSVAQHDIVAINGVNYTGEFFRFFAFSEIGSVGRIIKREDGAVTVERIEAAKS